ncbi:MAG: cytidylate kinase family protein [Desulfarculus sp.]|nr:cytidylate kinase family protein [Desulfarculus sp.]
MAVVTISRQVGSLGDEVAESLAKVLGYELVGASRLKDVACGLAPCFAEEVQDLQMERGLSVLERMFFAQPVYTSLYAAVILEVASRGNVVILGRGAQVVLREVPPVLRVRVVAPTALRVARVARAMGLEPEEARERVERHDQERRALVRQIFDNDLRDWGLYHLVLNTETLDQDGAVAILRQSVAEVRRLHPDEALEKTLKPLATAKFVEARLRRELLRSNLLKADLSPEGAIVLSGYLHAKEESRRAEDLARKLAGDLPVVNQIRVSTLNLNWPV